jgi:transposase
MKIRVVKTSSNAQAVQVVRYHNNKRVILRHIGSAHTNSELNALMKLAEKWIKEHVCQLSIFPEDNPKHYIYPTHSTFIGVKYRFFYTQVHSILNLIKLDDLPALLKDLVAIRIFEPTSKLRSIELLEQYFGIKHNRKTYYKIAPQCFNLKHIVEQKVTYFANLHYSFNFDLLFYDVTTLYFETFEEDELRKNGFSKDNKPQQPQILVALMVSKEGFPIAYEIFSGNTFEGHTIIPVIKDFINRNGIREFTVVADAAMLSWDNIQQLIQNNINYIVGARLGNITTTLLETIDKAICREDGRNIRIKTDIGYLVCSYSSVRYRKELYEMEKQIEKAKQIIVEPSRGKKMKFIQTKDQKVELNEALINKTRKLLGIKGYYTNLEASIADNKMIIERYHELYKIEQAFRISKSDLQTRPIFHFKEQPIKLHILICFLSLVVSKHIELKTEVSIKKFVNEAKKVVDGEILNQINDKIITIKAQQTMKMKEFITKLNIPH